MTRKMEKREPITTERFPFGLKRGEWEYPHDKFQRFDNYLWNPEAFSPVEYLIIWCFASRPRYHLTPDEIAIILSSSGIQIALEVIQRSLTRLVERKALQQVGDRYEIAD